MILENIDTNVNGNVESRACKIEANPVMYDILSNRLYKHKVRAVIRELSTNAVDSHKKAGNTDTPIKVQLPTILEPSFIIRDFGTGLIEQDIYDLYMTYGASDKRDSNLFNGALGVGSKSPFAYTQAFSVTSYFGGEATTYSVFSENGSPKIAKLGAIKTEEHTGLKIEVPVDDKDIYKFTEDARYVYQFLGYPVDLNFTVEPLFDKGSTDFKKGNWAIYPNMDESYIVMAGIGYNLKNLEVTDTDILNTEGLVIEVETGAVQFAASREELSLSPETIKKLQEIAKEIAGDFEEVAEKAIKGAEGLMSIINITGGMPRMFKEAISKKYSLIRNSYYGRMTLSFPKDWKVTMKTSEWRDTYKKIETVPEGFMKNPEEYTIILLDMVSYKNRIIAEHYPKDRKVLFISSTTAKTKENAKERFEEGLKLLGITKYKWATDFGYATTKRGKGAGTTKTTILEKAWSFSKVVDSKEGWTFISDFGTLKGLVNSNIDFYPIPMLRDYAYFSRNNVSPYAELYSFKESLLKSLSILGLLDRELYIVEVPRAQYNTMMNAGGKDWTELLTLKKKVTLFNYNETIRDLSKFGWDAVRYMRGSELLLEYLPKDLKRELDLIAKHVKGNKGLTIYSQMSCIADVTKAYKVVKDKDLKVQVVNKQLSTKLQDKYACVTGQYRKELCKMVDISYNNMSKIKETL